MKARQTHRIQLCENGYNQNMATTLTDKQYLYDQVFQDALRLSLEEQYRLREQLAKLAGANLIRPSKGASAMQEGRRLADEIREELKSTAGESLDKTMKRLRGRAWS